MDLEEIPETPTEENVTKDRTNSRIEKKKKRKAEGSFHFICFNFVPLKFGLN